MALAPTTFDDAPLGPHTWEARSVVWSRYTFDIRWMSYAFAEDLAFAPDAKLDVLLEVAFVGGSKLASDAEWVPWEDALRLLPRAAIDADKGDADAPLRKPTISAPEGGALLANFPWLADVRKDMETELTCASNVEGSRAKDVVDDPL